MLDQLSQYLQFLQVGAEFAITAAILAAIACLLLIIALVKLSTIEKGVRFNSQLLLGKTPSQLQQPTSPTIYP